MCPTFYCLWCQMVSYERVSPVADTKEEGMMHGEEKLTALQLEYTHLLSSQLESQRQYFEAKITEAQAKSLQEVQYDFFVDKWIVLCSYFYILVLKPIRIFIWYQSNGMKIIIIILLCRPRNPGRKQRDWLRNCRTWSVKWPSSPKTSKTKRRKCNRWARKLLKYIYVTSVP